MAFFFFQKKIAHPLVYTNISQNLPLVTLPQWDMMNIHEWKLQIGQH